MLSEHRAKLQLSSKLKYGNIKVLGVKNKFIQNKNKLKQMKNLLILLLLSVSLVTLANDTTYVTKDSVLVTKTTSIEKYKTIVSSPDFFNRLTIYDRKDRYGHYKEFVFYKNLKK